MGDPAVQIVKATDTDLPQIKALAYAIWPHTFEDILSSEQIEYMLQMMYDKTSLYKQMHTFRHRFFILRSEGVAVGFMSLEHHVHDQSKTKIHKIYLLPEVQGKGFGKKMISFAEEQALTHGDGFLLLNVNKYNPAIKFYEKCGFEVVNDEVIPIGKGFVMDDFVFEKKLHTYT